MLPHSACRDACVNRSQPALFGACTPHDEQDVETLVFHCSNYFMVVFVCLIESVRINALVFRLLNANLGA